jgi:hypothetical protein
MSPSEIVWDIQLHSTGTFDKLHPQTVRKWIDFSGTVPHWKDSTLQNAGKGNHPGRYNTQCGALVGSVSYTGVVRI